MTENLRKGSNTLISSSAEDILVIRLNWYAPSSYELTTSAFMLNSSGKVLNDEGMIFCNQPQSLDNALYYDANKQAFSLDLKKLNPAITKIVFTLTIKESVDKNQSFRNLDQAAIQVFKEFQLIVSYQLETSELTQENALIFAELYLHKEDWKFKAVGQGFFEGLPALAAYFGVTEIQQHPPNHLSLVEQESFEIPEPDEEITVDFDNAPSNQMSTTKKAIIGTAFVLAALACFAFFKSESIFQPKPAVIQVDANSFGSPSTIAPTATQINAAKYPQPVENYVNDFAHVLKETEAQELRQKLHRLESRTGIEGTVVTVKTMAEYATGANSIETFATGLFNYWGVGNKPTNKGFMVLVAVQDHKCRIELGRGFGGYYNDKMKEVISKTMIPLFKTDNYNSAIYDGTLSVINAVTRKTPALYYLQQLFSPMTFVVGFALLAAIFIGAKTKLSGPWLMLPAGFGIGLWFFPNHVFALFMFLLIVAVISDSIRNPYRYSRRYNYDDGYYNRDPWWYPSRHHSHHQNYDSSDYGSSNSSSDSGSFGGGSSSGDGASGEW